mmetsp:Transcript_6514/g.14381  ORF Transcript_6514/g.14381 Transcript_6514/m.14381 type:complete len:218 (+) Transcript_6514:433-1086(+)
MLLPRGHWFAVMLPLKVVPSPAQIRMIGTPLHNRVYHLLCRLDAHPRSCYLDATIFLMDLDAALGSSLYIVDGGTLSTDDVSDVRLGTVQYICLHSHGCIGRRCIRRRRVGGTSWILHHCIPRLRWYHLVLLAAVIGTTQIFCIAFSNPIRPAARRCAVDTLRRRWHLALMRYLSVAAAFPTNIAPTVAHTAGKTSAAAAPILLSQCRVSVQPRVRD